MICSGVIYRLACACFPVISKHQLQIYSLPPLLLCFLRGQTILREDAQVNTLAVTLTDEEEFS